MDDNDTARRYQLNLRVSRAEREQLDRLTEDRQKPYSAVIRDLIAEAAVA